MKPLGTVLLAFLFVAPVFASLAPHDGRIYGTVHTRDGETFEGLIRWDKNEVTWLDLLNGSKQVDTRYRAERRREISFGIFTTRFGDGGGSTRESGIRFGHIRRLDNVGSDQARLTLRSGEVVELQGGSTDIGTDIREILVEDARRGTITLRWRDLDYIEFGIGQRPDISRYGEPLYGTLTTRNGDTFTGWIGWDVDEALGEDELDGDDERGRDRAIPFKNIARIERYSSQAALVTLRSGEEIRLGNSNDVNSSNRGILVGDPQLGQIQVSWSEFDRLDFTAPPSAPSYESFPISRSLRGTVETRDGERYTGEIVWDADEAATWELLDGKLGDLQIDVEFGLIREIERLSSRAAMITLLDGRRLELRDSNDVNSDNNGIYIRTSSGEEIVLDWSDFARVTFDSGR